MSLYHTYKGIYLMASPLQPSSPVTPGSLQQRVAQYRDASGQLENTSGEELQTLASKAGLQAPPTNAVVAGQIGASPDQQKMAAAPQTVQSALQLSQLGPQQNLATAQREQQANSTQTQQDQTEKGQAQQLQGLSDTETRVQSAIDAAIKNITVQPAGGTQTTPGTSSATGGASQASTALPQVNTTSALYQGAANQQQLTADLQAYQANPTDLSLLTRINTDLGRDQTSQISPAELQGLYQDSTTTIANNVASQLPTGYTVGQLASQPGFGYSMDQLSTVLGVPAAQLSGYSIAQLGQAVAAQQQAEFSRAQQIDAQATSQNLGQAERNTAQLQGRDLAAQGVRATEDDVAKLQQSVANGDKVQFGGQTYTVEDLLGNSQVSKAVTDYLNAPAGSPTQLQLQQTEPDLVKFINDNQALLTDATNKMASATTQLGNIQTQNTQVGTYGNEKLDDTTLSALIPGYDPNNISSAAYNTSSPVFSYLGSLSPTDAQTAAGAINTLSDAQKQELSTMSPKELAGLQLQLGTNSPVLKTLEAANQARTTVEGLTPSDPNTVISTLTGGKYDSLQQVQAAEDEQTRAAALGLAPAVGNFGGLDTNKDGKIDDMSSLIASAQKQVGTQPLTLEQALSGKTQALQPSSVDPTTMFTPEQMTPAQQNVWNILAPYGKDGSISPQDLQKSKILGSQTLMQEMVDGGMLKNMPVASKNAIQTALLKDQVAQANTLMKKYPGLSSASMDKLVNGLSAGVNGYNDTTALTNSNNAIASLQKQVTGLQAAIKAAGETIDPTTAQEQVKTLQGQIAKLRAANKPATDTHLASAAADNQTTQFSKTIGNLF